MTRTVSLQTGFSLVEMLVVLGLLAIATAISFPVLQNSNRQNEIAVFQLLVMKSLNDARNKALLSGQDQYVDIDIKRRTVSGTIKTITSFPAAIKVTTESAKFDELQNTSRYVFFGAGGNSGGKIVVERVAQNDGQTPSKIEIALNWFSGEISSVVVRDADGS